MTFGHVITGPPILGTPGPHLYIWDTLFPRYGDLIEKLIIYMVQDIRIVVNAAAFDKSMALQINYYYEFVYTHYAQPKTTSLVMF